MRFLSLFSGIEAASEAWVPIGWECAGVSEIDPFACAVLAHRHPHVPNLGDITKITEMQIAALGHIDLVVFGSPCQDLSVAGKQKGLSGERSGLFYPAVDIISWARLWCGTRFALWENVPGAFSSNQGRDFAAVVGTLAGLDDIAVPPKGWGTEGCAVGTEAMVEWATRDAQWFGVAQRRRRIFALADFGNWAGRSPILLEPEGVRGDSAPSREARQTAPTIPARSTAGGGLGTDFDCDGGVVQVCPTLRPAKQWPAEVSSTLDTTFGTKQGLEDQHVNAGCPLFVPVTTHSLRGEGFDASEDGTARAMKARDYKDATDLVAIAHVPCMPTLRSGGGSAASHGAVSGDSKDEYIVPVCTTGSVTHTLTAEGFDASEDGTGRGTPVIAFNLNQVTSPTNRSRVEPGAPCPTLTKFGEATCVAFHSNAQADPLPTSSRDTRVTDALTCPQTAAVALSVALRGREGGGTAELGDEIAGCLRASSGGGDKPHVLTATAVRRLTPTECERLQGFPDNHTQIPWRNKPADQCPDGPRYKALGNSMAVPVMRWIGQKIDVALLFQE